MFYVKIHKSESGNIAAVCDEDLLGKTFTSNGLKINVSEYFLKGRKNDKEFISGVLNNCCSANLVGKNAIDLATELGIISKENIILVEGVPHAVAFLIWG